MKNKLLKVLIVDDNVSDLNGIKELIDWKDLGFCIAGTSHNGKDGIRLAHETAPDLIITDVSMPHMDGFEMVTEIKKFLPQVRIIVISCFDDFEYMQQALSQKVDHYILKPIDIDELIKAVLNSKNIHENLALKQLEEYNAKQMLKASVPLLCENFIVDLLYGRTDTTIAAERMNYLNLHDSACRIILFSFEKMSVEEDYIKSVKMKPKIERHLRRIFPTICVYIEENQIAAIIDVEENSKLENDVFEIFEQILSESDNRVYIIISNIIKSKMQLNSHFLSLKKSASISGKYSNILFEKDSPSYSPLELNFDALYGEMSDIFETNNNEKIKEFVNKYIISGKNTESTRSIVYVIIGIAYSLTADKPHQADGILAFSPDIINKINSFDSDFDIKMWTYNILSELQKTFFVSEKGKYEKIIDDIKKIIDKDYADISSIGVIAERIQMSSGYINKLFKQYTDETINDYLLTVRMKAAAKLLKDPYIKVYEVAYKTGYESTAYFTSVFKNFYGITPKAFRTENIQKSGGVESASLI